MKIRKGRGIVCSHCARKFWGGGTTRVMLSICFHFCGRCWGTKREACVDQMYSVTNRAGVVNA